MSRSLSVSFGVHAMRFLIAILSITALLSVSLSTAEAGRRKSHARHYVEPAYGGRVYGWRHSSGESHDRVRAQSCDAAGEYSGYPDWARAAFTCGRSR